MLVPVLFLGSKVSHLSTKIDRFFGEFRRRSVDLGNGFSSRRDSGGVLCSKILAFVGVLWNFVRDLKLLSVENLKGAEQLGVKRGFLGCPQKEGNVFIDCKNGNHNCTLKTRKLFDLGKGFCLLKDVGVVCSKILSCGCSFWRLIKKLVLFSNQNSKGYGDMVIAIGRGFSDHQKMEKDFRNFSLNYSRTFKAMEEEAGFDECEVENFVGFEEEHQTADLLDCRIENYSSTFTMRKFTKEDDEEEGKDCDAYGKGKLIELKNALGIETERRKATYLELEKERTAAASAADEAIAMIQRLQNEKYWIEMEAYHYRCEAEQKQLYDQEVIQSLEWIISKHELERSVLESQLEQYRKRLRQRSLVDEVVGEAEEQWIDEMGSDLLFANKLK